MEEVDVTGEDIDETVRRIAGPTPPQS